MAPFKLKFRMGGSSRSTSQEVDPDPQVNEALLNNQSTAIGASNSTIDSADCTSLGSMGNNERKSLLPNKLNALRLGYLNPNIKQCTSDSNSSSSSSPVPKSPPPSYEHVLEENTRLANSFDLGSRLTLSNEDGIHSIAAAASAGAAADPYHPLQKNARINSSHSLRKSSNLTLCDRISLSNLCTDPDCSEANVVGGDRRDNRISQLHLTATSSPNDSRSDENDNNNDNGNDDYDEDDDNDGNGTKANERHKDRSNRKESIGSREFLISSKMDASSGNGGVDNCNSADCQHRCSANGVATNNYGFCDPLMNQEGYCTDEMCSEDHWHNDGSHQDLSLNHQQPPPEYSENPNGIDQQQQQSDSESDDGCWDSNQMSQMSGSYQQQQQQQQQQHQNDPPMTTEIISNKSSKEIYKALAKQLGITCKMSDTCRCMDCQSRYFDCEYDENDQQETDGGLGAGTPMFISEVMHGSVCNIL